jgi:transcriptional regulator with XRE-family HTH domain
LNANYWGKEAMMRGSDEPFPTALKELLRERDMSQRELIRQTRKHGWGSAGAISFLINEELVPTMRAMEAIARALKIRPEHFAEYRLAVARRNLDPSAIGLKAALRNLDGR